MCNHTDNSKSSAEHTSPNHALRPCCSSGDVQEYCLCQIEEKVPSSRSENSNEAAIDTTLKPLLPNIKMYVPFHRALQLDHGFAHTSDHTPKLIYYKAQQIKTTKNT